MPFGRESPETTHPSPLLQRCDMWIKGESMPEGFTGIQPCKTESAMAGHLKLRHLLLTEIEVAYFSQADLADPGGLTQAPRRSP